MVFSHQMGLANYLVAPECLRRPVRHAPVGSSGLTSPTTAQLTATYRQHCAASILLVPIRRKGSKLMPTGTVKFFNAAKGYGFITPEGGGNDVFVHVSELERSSINTLNDGDRVSFDTKMDPQKGEADRGEHQEDLSFQSANAPT